MAPLNNSWLQSNSQFYLLVALPINAKFVSDDYMEVYADGRLVQSCNSFWDVYTFQIDNDVSMLAVDVNNVILCGSFIAQTSTGVVTDTTWKCTTTYYAGWNEISFDDSNWPNATAHVNNVPGYCSLVLPINSCCSSNNQWIGVADRYYLGHFYCRKRLCV